MHASKDSIWRGILKILAFWSETKQGLILYASWLSSRLVLTPRLEERRPLLLCIHSPMASCPGENLKKNSFLLSTANNCAIIKRNCKQLCCYQQYMHPTVNSNGEKWLNFYLGAWKKQELYGGSSMVDAGGKRDEATWWGLPLLMFPFWAAGAVSVEAFVGDAKGLSGKMCSTTPLQSKQNKEHINPGKIKTKPKRKGTSCTKIQLNNSH